MGSRLAITQRSDASGLRRPARSAGLPEPAALRPLKRDEEPLETRFHLLPQVIFSRGADKEFATSEQLSAWPPCAVRQPRSRLLSEEISSSRPPGRCCWSGPRFLIEPGAYFGREQDASQSD